MGSIIIESYKITIIAYCSRCKSKKVIEIQASNEESLIEQLLENEYEGWIFKSFVENPLLNNIHVFCSNKCLNS